MESIKEKQDEIIEDFEMFEDWTEKYEYIIELGFELPPLDSKYKTEEFRIIGCQSNVWLRSYLSDESKVIYEADSEAMIVKGLASLALKIFSNEKPEDIVSADIFMFKEIGMSEHLSPTRANGLSSMIKRIKSDALNYIKN